MNPALSNAFVEMVDNLTKDGHLVWTEVESNYLVSNELDNLFFVLDSKYPSVTPPMLQMRVHDGCGSVTSCFVGLKVDELIKKVQFSLQTT